MQLKAKTTDTIKSLKDRLRPSRRKFMAPGVVIQTDVALHEIVPVMFFPLLSSKELLFDPQDKAAKHDGLGFSKSREQNKSGI